MQASFPGAPTRRVTALLPLLRVLTVTLLIATSSACSDRDRLNPVDPLNPATHGVPWQFRALAGNTEVRLDWSTFDLDDLVAFRIDRMIGTGPDSVIARLDPDLGSFTDRTAENGREYRYRLVPLLGGDRPVAIDGPVGAIPGPQIPWVADTGGFQVARLAPDGRAVVFRRSGFRAPNSLSVSPRDGLVWVADSCNGRVVALNIKGETVLAVGDFGVPKAVAASPADGSVWVADEERGEVVRLAADGTLLARTIGLDLPADVAANPADHSAWAADAGAREVLLIAADGTVTARIGSFGEPLQVAAVHADRSCWVADDDLGRVTRVAPDGSTLAEIAQVLRPFGLAVDQATGDVWVGSFAEGSVERYSAGGVLELTVGGFAEPLGIALDPVDGGVWVVDSRRDEVVKVSATGIEIGRTGGYSTPFDVDVGSTQ